jgi:uncharacterized protein YggE
MPPHGKGSVHVKPDLARLDVGVSTEAKTPLEAQTSQYSLEAIRDRTDNAVSGSRATNELSIAVRDISRLGESWEQWRAKEVLRSASCSLVSHSSNHTSTMPDLAFEDAKNEARLSAEAAGVQYRQWPCDATQPLRFR